MSDLTNDILSATKGVTKKWKAEKRKADKQDRVASNRLQRMRSYVPRYTIRDAAFDVMEEAYNKASSNGKYYATARQIMYAARPKILARTEKDELNDNYFTQTLLKDYIEEGNVSWKVVWDARGHLIEPYTKKIIGLGGIEVEQYIHNWHSETSIEPPEIKELFDTSGPHNRFNNALFIEKEGFTEILKDAGIPERYDMAIMSTKGIPVKASCDLIEGMQGAGVRTFVLHDFDLYGFKIIRTLREGTRPSYGSDVIELGFRMCDIEGLESEPVYYRQKEDPRIYLEVDCGVTEEEANFLAGKGYRGLYRGRRVELNAMTSEQLITWLENKFKEHDVQKLIPEPEVLEVAYKRAVYLKTIEEIILEIEEEVETEPPNDIRDKIIKQLKKSPGISWDRAIWNIATAERP